MSALTNVLKMEAIHMNHSQMLILPNFPKLEKIKVQQNEIGKRFN